MYSKNRFNILQILKAFEKGLGFRTELKWTNIFIVFGYHIFGLYWCYLHAFEAKWQTVLFALTLYHLSGKGIICGAHRLWTHRTYKASLPLRIYLMLCYAIAGQNSIYSWVRLHRAHHKYSDTDADPHNASRGFFFSHMGWIMMKSHKLVAEKGRQVDMSDIEADPVLKFERKYSAYLGTIIGHILPTLISIYLLGDSWKCAIAWLNFIRPLGTYHAEWSVNSLAHTFGNKPYNENIYPTQNFFVSFITGGEGWHNYHHMFPYDYKASEFFNCSLATGYIRLWSKLGLASDLKEPSPELIKSTVERHKNNSKVMFNVNED